MLETSRAETHSAGQHSVVEMQWLGARLVGDRVVWVVPGSSTCTVESKVNSLAVLGLAIVGQCVECVESVGNHL